jgi:hypothetical protein
MTKRISQCREISTSSVALFCATLGVSSFALNWLWEMLQMPAYVEMAGRSWAQTAGLCTRAAFGDVVLTFGVFGLGSLAAGRLRWSSDGEWNAYAAAALIGATFATVIEYHALAMGRWSYTNYMPIVPALGIGLWPLLQLTLLAPAALWIARHCCRRRTSDES